MVNGTSIKKKKKKSMRKCLSKFYDKPFTLHTPPLTAGHLKKVASGIQKKRASGVHCNYGYEKFTQSIKSSLMDVYDKFPPQSCWVLLFKEGGIKDILYCPKGGGNTSTKMKRNLSLR